MSSEQWLSSNMSIEQSYLIALEKQLHELQEYVYSHQFSIASSFVSNYYHVRIGWNGFICEDTYRMRIQPCLDVLFQQRHQTNPIFAVWRWFEPFEIPNTIRLDVYIFFESYLTEHELRTAWIQSNPNMHLLSITRIHDSYQFIQLVRRWKPTPDTLFASHGCEAWYRYIHPIESNFMETVGIPFTQSTNYCCSVAFQEKLKEAWETEDGLNQLFDIDNFEKM